MIQQGDGSSARSIAQRAAHLVAVGRFAEAIPLLSSALATQPQDADIRCDLALALMGARRLVEADREAYHAIATAPDYERAYRVRSIVLREAGRADDAVTMGREAVRLAPDKAQAVQVLAQACISAKRHAEAWTLANRAVEVAPQSAVSHNLVAQAAIGLRLWAVAERASREALRLDAHDWSAMNNLGVALHRQGRRADAAQAYERAAQMNSAAETPRRNLVRAVRPAHGSRYLLDVLLVLLLPILAPFIVVKWIVLWAMAYGARERVSRGAREYYRSQTVLGGVRRLTPREFGIVCGTASVVVWWILAVPAGVGLSLLVPQSPILDFLLTTVAALALAVGTGFLCGWLRSRRRRQAA